ncbi:RDD family protein [Nocardia vinacea]|uniref:RDD family protein n=1 Tax=Nocardia vinacea TaxID=96468 RepID=A0ABZ1YN54_9NOCA|nr:RDD family protein [Nocardia vinacea]
MSTSSTAYLTIPSGRYRLAGMGTRLGARLIDTVIVGIPIGIVAAVVLANTDSSHEFPADSDTDSGFGLATALLVVALGLLACIAYEVGLTATQGATFGKKALGIRVVRIDTADAPGEGIGGAAALIRWATLMLPSVLCGVWGVVCAASPYFDHLARQGWHDKVAKTFVLAAL